MNKAFDTNTRERIHKTARIEFMEKGYQSASLRNIMKTAGMTTGAFYGYYRSKEELFESLVGTQYEHFMSRYRQAQQEFAALPAVEQPEHMSDISGECMVDMLLYAYEHLDTFKLLLLSSEGTRFSGMVDEMVEIELQATHDYQEVLQKLGMPATKIDPKLEHILITGMFNAYFELIIHEMPVEQALEYLNELRAFYTAGWKKLMGQ